MAPSCMRAATPRWGLASLFLPPLLIVFQEPAYGPPSNYSAPVVLSEVRKLVKTVKNGKLYTAVLPNPGWANASQTVYVIHMYGTSYEQGAGWQ
jgi:hypothetical protein